MQILKDAYLERKSRNQNYSTRAFARDIGISQTFLSLIFNGKRKLSITQASKVAGALKLSEDDTAHFIEQVLIESNGKLANLLNRKKKNSTKYIQYEVDRFRIISQWYHLPILDLSTTKNFKSDPEWIARRLEISAFEAREAVERLIRLGLFEKSGASLRKTESKIFFPTQKSDPAIRDFHKQMMLKAVNAMNDSNSFEKRDISGMTIAINPKRLSEAKNKIREFQKELADFLSEGACTEVYQFNSQLFSLTKELS